MLAGKRAELEQQSGSFADLPAEIERLKEVATAAEALAKESVEKKSQAEADVTMRAEPPAHRAHHTPRAPRPRVRPRHTHARAAPWAAPPTSLPPRARACRR